MKPRLRSEIHKDFLTFLEKDNAYSFLLTLVTFLLLHTYKNGAMLNAPSFSFGIAVLGRSAVCRYQRTIWPSKGEQFVPLKGV